MELEYAVMYTKDVKMFNNTFEQNWGDSAYGLLLKDISDSYIFNNKFISTHLPFIWKEVVVIK